MVISFFFFHYILLLYITACSYLRELLAPPSKTIIYDEQGACVAGAKCGGSSQSDKPEARKDRISCSLHLRPVSSPARDVEAVA